MKLEDSMTVLLREQTRVVSEQGLPDPQLLQWSWCLHSSVESEVISF